MPSRNAIKEYLEDGVYHIYNRGINKQDIFTTAVDYKTFLYFLKQYLSDPANLQRTVLPEGQSFVNTRRNFAAEIDLLAYCLMPNHFHLIVKQSGDRDIAGFMKCLSTSYSIFFNTEYDRTGTLFQGRYKAILVKEDDYSLHLSRYIHMNPLPDGPKIQDIKKLCECDYSSYADYLGKRTTKWLNTEIILDYFNENKDSNLIDKFSYQGFVEESGHNPKDILGNLTLE